MHSRIYSLEKELTADEFLMDFPWFVGSIADYVDDKRVTVSEELEYRSDMNGISVDAENGTITLSDGDAYFRNIVDACELASCDIPDDGVPATQIWKDIMSRIKEQVYILNDKFGVYVVYDDMLLTLNEFLGFYPNRQSTLSIAPKERMGRGECPFSLVGC